MQKYKINWPIDVPTVNALTTMRYGGVSELPFAQLNLAEHVEDNPRAVKANREILLRYLQSKNNKITKQNIFWLNQTHSTIVSSTDDFAFNGDGVIAYHPLQVCTSMTADCLPVFICDTLGSVVAAVHAGWRGLCEGIIENALDKIIKDTSLDKSNLQVAFGPAIGPCCFEVGAEVRQAFVVKDSQDAEAFTVVEDNESQSSKIKYLANIYALAHNRVSRYGVKHIADLPRECTRCQADKYFSYRREAKCGRMVSLIWRD